MNKVFKALTIAALATVLAVGAFAQAAGPQGGGVKGGVQGGGGELGKLGKGGLRGNQKIEEEIWAKLSPALSADQKTKLAQIDQKTKDSVKALRDKAKKGDREAMKGEAQKIMQTRRESIKALLTPEQHKSYMTLMKEALEKLRKDKGAGKGTIKKNG